jgi:PKD repeat protein
MYHGRNDTSGSPLVIAVFSVILLLVSGGASAENVGNGTPGLMANASTTNGSLLPVTVTDEIIRPTITMFPNTTTLDKATPVPEPPPRIVLNKTDTKNLAVTVYGSAIPGSPNASITTIRWDWGENSLDEYHEFPYSHTYSNPGTYTLSITAIQSDGRNATRTETLLIEGLPVIETLMGSGNMSFPAIPLGPGMQAGAPVLTLLEPVIDGLNVTLNGNLNPGSPSATITSVEIDWDDGSQSGYLDLPATHQYSDQGIYTVNITGKQSDGQSTSKSITLNVKPGNPGPPGPTGDILPPGTSPDLIIILVIVVLIAVAGIVARWGLQRRREQSAMHDIRKNISVQEGIYDQAMEKGDLETAATSARACVRMLRSLADESPQKRAIYLEMADTWEHLGMNAEKARIPGAMAQNMSVIPGDLPSREELEQICTGTGVTPDVLDAVIRVAIEIGREGREGQSVGTSFVVGDTGKVLTHSKQFVLNPFYGHKEEERRITDVGIRENIKEFAQLDGAFIITDTGIVEAAGRYITLDMSQVNIPGGLGSRHSSIAGITLATRSIGIVVSQSGGRISIFRDGQIVLTIHA